jgi:hypothetical protein
MRTACWTLTIPLLLGAGQENADARRFVSTEGNFSVVFPCTPSQDHQRVKTASGHLDVEMFLAEGKNDVSYVVSYSDLPEAEAKKGTEAKRLNFARDGAVTKSRGKLRSEKPIELAGYPGRELIIDTDTESVLRLRIFVVERRLFQVMVVGPGANVLQRDGTFFLDSFRLGK